MSKKKIKAANAEPLRYPEWYWHYGLHDAKILSVSEMQLFPDYKSKEQKYNLFEITLDSSATYEQDVKIIRLYTVYHSTSLLLRANTVRPYYFVSLKSLHSERLVLWERLLKFCLKVSTFR